MTQRSMEFTRTLQLIGLFFAFSAGIVVFLNIVLDWEWDLVAGIFFTSTISQIIAVTKANMTDGVTNLDIGLFGLSFI